MRWLTGGVAFGLLFPLLGWMAAGSLSFSGINYAHRSQPVLFLVDLAPVVLGCAGYCIGLVHARLIRSRRSIEEAVELRTLELSNALADLEELMAEKDALLADKDRFVASVSHELRTPLTSVMGLAEVLTDPERPVGADEQQELLGLLASECAEVVDLVEDLLVAARAERGQLSVTLAPTALRQLALEVADAMGCSPCCVVGEEVVASADPVRTRQIVRNLLSNAQRYGGSAVRIEAAAEAASATLTIADDGAGVAGDDVERIFDPYFRAHERPGQTDAVGLGLSVSRQLATLMGGSLTYRRAGDRSRFTLELPAAAESPTSPPHAAVDA